MIAKKHTVLTGMIISVVMIVIATQLYPGGSMFDRNAVGFHWTKNFFSNLFAPKALNGMDNPARFWAGAGMIFLSLSFAVFFNGFSKKIPVKSAAMVIKYSGAVAMVFTFLIVTPWHDVMVTISGTIFLVCFFYITVFVLKSQLLIFKFLCVIYMLLFYYTFYLYGAGDFALLAIVQKIIFISSILLILALQYFTKKEDFEDTKKAETKNKKQDAGAQ